MRKITKIELINEKSRAWLFWKGVGISVPLVSTAIIAFFAYQQFDLANSERLSRQLNIILNEKIQMAVQNDSLKNAISKYEGNRFILRHHEARNIADNIFIKLLGWPHHEIYIFEDTARIKYYSGFSEGVAYHFNVGDKEYYFVIERRFITDEPGKYCLDSMSVYLKAPDNQTK